MATPETRPLVTDLRRGSLDDGPGIRSVVFFKGCPLRCAWCQNPESLSPNPELQQNAGSCLGCRACEPACSRGIARPAAAEAQPHARRAACDACSACVDACPSAARRIVGTWVPMPELFERLMRDAVFYRRSGGGVTLSGGEPTLYTEEVGWLAARLRAAEVHVLVETCGHFEWERFAEHLLPQVATIYFDLKLADSDEHARWVGPENHLIHANLCRLVAAGSPDLLVRIPLVPGVTDTTENLTALARLVTEAGLERVALLPYNPLWLSKRRARAGELSYTHAGWMSAADIARCEAVINAAGVRVVSGGQSRPNPGNPRPDR